VRVSSSMNIRTCAAMGIFVLWFALVENVTRAGVLYLCLMLGASCSAVRCFFPFGESSTRMNDSSSSAKSAMVTRGLGWFSYVDLRRFKYRATRLLGS